MKKAIALIWIGVLCLALLLYSFAPPRPQEEEPTTLPTEETAAQTQPQTEPPTQPQMQTEPEPQPAQVRFLNQDPVRQTAWERLAAEFTEQTGVPVTVISAAAKESDDADGELPTLFTLSGEAELEQWKDQCLDLSGSDAYAQLASWDLTLCSDGKVCGIAQSVEVFGLVYNSSLLARAGHTRADINGLESLKTVAEFITANSAELGFSAFASPNLKGSVAARLASLPGNMRAFWNLYITNTSGEIGNTSASDSLQEFLDGKAVFYLANIRDYGKLAPLGDHQLGILPLYIGAENEGKQSLCAAADSYWCVRNDAPEQDIQAALDFLRYLVHPRDDSTVPVDDLGLLAPYRQAVSANNVLETTLRSDLAAGKECLICTAVTTEPEGLADALAAYAAAPTDENWKKVTLLLQG